MKAEHRKELQTNILADRMGRALHQLKEAPSRSTTLIVGGVILVAVLYIVWTLVSHHTLNTNSELWEQWYALNTPADLDTFAKDHDKTLAGRLARFRSARLDLGKGMADFGNPLQRNQALQSLRAAAQAYEALIPESANQPLLQQEAMLNAGKAYETLDEADKARGFYQRLAQAFPKTMAGKEAAAALERLDRHAKDLETLKKLAQETTTKPITPPSFGEPPDVRTRAKTK